MAHDCLPHQAETDQSMFCGARRAARRIAAARYGASGAVPSAVPGAVSGVPQAYVYRFARGVGGSAWSHHSNDIPFWFGALEAVAAGGPPVPKGKTRMLITTYLGVQPSSGHADDEALTIAMATSDCTPHQVMRMTRH